MGKFPNREREKIMRTFTIPAPPNDLKAVRDWKGIIWIRRDLDKFEHHSPDAENPTVRTWWDLISEGKLTECAPKRQSHII